LSKIHATEIGERRKIGHFDIVPFEHNSNPIFLNEVNPKNHRIVQGNT
jgi:hypothetical protein